ncbi:MAG: PTS sugar transporter subunit IIA [Fusobacterium sp.]
MCKENRIKLNVEAKTWEEAIYKAAEILEEDGVIKPSYKDAIIESTKKTGPYYVITKGVAMPHARPEDGVIKSGFCFLKLKEGVYFGSKENDPVKYIFMVAMENNEKHIEFIQFLSDLMENEEFYKAVDENRPIEEIKSFFK